MAADSYQAIFIDASWMWTHHGASIQQAIRIVMTYRVLHSEHVDSPIRTLQILIYNSPMVIGRQVAALPYYICDMYGRTSVRPYFVFIPYYICRHIHR